MVSLSLFTAALILTCNVAATPFRVVNKSPISLPISKRLNSVRLKNIHSHDLQRLRTRAATACEGSEAINAPLDFELTGYFANVGVGNPPKNFTLLLDTGSSNTWVGANSSNPYVETSTSIKTEDKVQVQYGSGNFSGNEFFDEVTIAPGLTIKNQSIGVAITSPGFDAFDGILGLGPTVLTNHTLTLAKDSTIPTVTDNAFAQNLIPDNLVGISFEPLNKAGELNGQITWGGVDQTKIIGNISYAPITKDPKSSKFWGIDIDQPISYGSTEILQPTSGIVDTGTTAVLLATDAFDKYMNQTGAHLDEATGLLAIPCSKLETLQSLYFHINEVTYELTPNAQLWPRSLNIDGDADEIFLIVGDLGTKSGQGPDFVLGIGFLQRFYSVYDTANQRVGLAMTPFTNATTN